ncbi:MAG TPA: DUF4142 domain-containing protein [Burkholderiales bacterium]|nr:DUF4142 domain-containing protein [Burkholderiales bacterium]
MLNSQHLSRLLGAAVLGALCSAYAYADSGKLHANDWSWMEKVARADAAEIRAGQLAQSKAVSPQVRAFAEKMVADHTKTSTELKALASDKGVFLPDEPDAAHKSDYAKLQRLTGPKFDEQYMERAGVNDHKAAVALFKRGTTSLYDPDVKAFAQNTLPAIQHHYEMAQGLEQ